MASSPWIVVSIGVAVMLVLFVIAIGAYRGPGPNFEPVPPGAPPVAAAPIPERASSAGWEFPVPPSLAVPGLSPRRSDSPSPTPDGTPAPDAPPTGTASVAAPPSPAPPSPVPVPSASTSSRPAASPASLDARYRIMQTFHGGFIAEVNIRNTSRNNLSWVARIDYPGGRVVTAWLEGVPQGTFNGDGGVLTYRSGPELAPGTSVQLRFHIEAGRSRPASCTVSGQVCADS
ncbi:cellulose binding domain-containing protein [Micromonospora sp. HNM0581]|uniref:cellulose binding domain-containing protein n=1 Tax=Micromonospora sp. HNM0581 TaxID=2716341 RepID=UPI00321639D5